MPQGRAPQGKLHETIVAKGPGGLDLMPCTLFGRAPAADQGVKIAAGTAAGYSGPSAAGASAPSPGGHRHSGQGGAGRNVGESSTAPRGRALKKPAQRSMQQRGYQRHCLLWLGAGARATLLLGPFSGVGASEGGRAFSGCTYMRKYLFVMHPCVRAILLRKVQVQTFTRIWRLRGLFFNAIFVSSVLPTALSLTNNKCNLFSHY